MMAMGKKAFIAAVLVVLLIVIGGIFGYSLVGETGFSPKVSPSTQPTGQTTQSPSPTPTPTPIPTTVQPSPSTSSSTTPQPTPTPMQAGAVSMAYYEVSREEVGNDTRIKVSINATNNSASTVALDHGSFHMDIVTLVDSSHPLAIAKYNWKITGEAVPLENGTKNVSGSNAPVSCILTFELTFEFPTLQTFGEWASAVDADPDTEYPFSSYLLHYGNLSPIKPFSSSNEFSSIMDNLQGGKLTLENGNFPAPWPFTLIRVPLTVEHVNSGIAYTNQGNFSIFSSSNDFQGWIYNWCIPTNTNTVYYWLSDPSGSQFAFWVYIPHGQNSRGAIYGNTFS